MAIHILYHRTLALVGEPSASRAGPQRPRTASRNRTASWWRTAWTNRLRRATPCRAGAHTCAHAAACHARPRPACHTPHRKPHRESTIGEYTPPLNEKGGSIQRKGFHVECNTDLDCFSRCGTHPVSGTHYACTHNLGLYSLAGYSKEAYTNQVAASASLKAAGEPHPKVWLPDDTDDSFYLMEEPGILTQLEHFQHYTRLPLRSTFAWLLLAHVHASKLVMSAHRLGQIGFNAIHSASERMFRLLASQFSREHCAKRLERPHAFFISTSSP